MCVDCLLFFFIVFFFQAEDGIRDFHVTGVQTCALPICYWRYLQEVVPVFFEWHEQPGTWPDAPKGRTRREIIALRRGLPVYRARSEERRVGKECRSRGAAES